MGNGDHRKTRELDKTRLAELTGSGRSKQTTTPAVTLGRTKTLDDPLTTGLLAEVARSAQTKEFDPETIQELLDAVDEDAAVIVDKPRTHPNTRRREG
jgi:hypothetical protein